MFADRYNLKRIVQGAFNCQNVMGLRHFCGILLKAADDFSVIFAKIYRDRKKWRES
jgi:hypothetical protein